MIQLSVVPSQNLVRGQFSLIEEVGLQCSSLKALSALLAGTVHSAGTHLREPIALGTVSRNRHDELRRSEASARTHAALLFRGVLARGSRSFLRRHLLGRPLSSP